MTGEPEADIPGFHNVEVNDRDLESKEHAVKDVVLPSQSIQRNAIDELIEEQRRSNARAHPCETLSPKTVRQDLSGVVRHQSGLDVVKDAVEEDDCDESMTKLRLGRDCVPSRDDGEDVEADERSNRRDEVDRATTQLIDQECETEVLDERNGLHAAVDTELSLRVRHANVVHDIL